METIIGVLAVMGVVLSFMVLVLSVKLSTLDENHKGLVNDFNILKSFTIQRINILSNHCGIISESGYPTDATSRQIVRRPLMSNILIEEHINEIIKNICLIEEHLGITYVEPEILPAKYVKKTEPAETTNA